MSEANRTSQGDNRPSSDTSSVSCASPIDFADPAVCQACKQQDIVSRNSVHHTCTRFSDLFVPPSRPWSDLRTHADEASPAPSPRGALQLSIPRRTSSQGTLVDPPALQHGSTLPAEDFSDLLHHISIRVESPSTPPRSPRAHTPPLSAYLHPGSTPLSSPNAFQNSAAAVGRVLGIIPAPLVITDYPYFNTLEPLEDLFKLVVKALRSFWNFILRLVGTRP